MNATAGIDVGSTYTKAALVDEDGAAARDGDGPTGFRLEAAAADALEEARAAAGSAGRRRVPLRAPATAATARRAATSR
jgi:activator of 2-hydroxyglutaryl-CoA dehydratase